MNTTKCYYYKNNVCVYFMYVCKAPTTQELSLNKKRGGILCSTKFQFNDLTIVILTHTINI